MDRLSARLLLRRAVLLWLLLRLVVAAVGSLMLHPLAAALFAAVVGAVMLIDMRASREEVFLASLGIGARHVFAFAAGVALLLEGLVAMIATLILALGAGP